MSKDAKNVPALRFKGFSDAWEKRKFGDLYKLNKEKNENAEFLNENTLSIATMTINKKGNGAAKKSLLKYKVIRIGDIAFEGHTSKKFAFGRFVLNDVANGIMSPRFTCLRPIHPQIIQFWKQYIHYEPILRPILIRSTKLGTMMNELVVPDLLKQNIHVPNIKEQKLIGKSLSRVDDLIAATQGKIDGLEKIKKALLQHLFDQSMRFKGYSDPWEKRKLAEVAEINPKSEIPETFRYVDLESVKGSAIINSRSETRQTAPSRAQRTARIGDVFYQTVRPYQRNNVIFLLRTTEPYVFSSGYAQLRSLVNPFFILYLVQSDNFVNRVLNRATGTSYPAINPTHLSSIPVWIPQSFSEQKRVGQLLRRLDNLIAATQSKLSSLETLKKALLQGLFI